MRNFQIFFVTVFIFMVFAAPQCDFVDNSTQWSRFYPGMTPQDMVVVEGIDSLEENIYTVTGFELCQMRTLQIDACGFPLWFYPFELKFDCDTPSTSQEIAATFEGYAVVGYAQSDDKFQIQVQELSFDGALKNQDRFGDFSATPWVYDSLASSADLWFVGEADGSAFLGSHSLTENQNMQVFFDVERAGTIDKVEDGLIIAAQSSLNMVENYEYEVGDETPQLTFQHSTMVDVDIISQIILSGGDCVIMTRLKNSSSKPVMYLMRFTSAGDLVWTRSYEVYGVKMMRSADSVVVLGTDTESDPEGNILLVFFYLEDGYFHDFHLVYREGSDRSVDFYPTVDGGFIVTSASIVDGIGGTWVLKIDKNLSYPNDITFIE